MARQNVSSTKYAVWSTATCEVFGGGLFNTIADAKESFLESIEEEFAQAGELVIVSVTPILIGEKKDISWTQVSDWP